MTNSPTLPKYILLELIQGAGVMSGLYLNDHRIIDSKSVGDGRCVHGWHLKAEPLAKVFKVTHQRGVDQLLVEIYQHKDQGCSVYLDNVVLPARLKRDWCERRPGSVLIVQAYVNVAELAKAHDLFKSIHNADPWPIPTRRLAIQP